MRAAHTKDRRDAFQNPSCHQGPTTLSGFRPVRWAESRLATLDLWQTCVGGAQLEKGQF
jgi:hypothetical protein